MAVSRAEKEQELQESSSAFGAADTAILVDYRGLNVPAATELRRQARSAKAQDQVVKKTLARRATKGTRLAFSRSISRARPVSPLPAGTPWRWQRC